MKEINTQIKNGVNLHVIQNEKFKTNLAAVFVTLKLTRKDVTKNALIPAVLRRGTANLQTQEEINKKLENMYGALFDCGIEKIGDNHVMKFYLETLNDTYVPNEEKLTKIGLDTLFDIVFNPYLEAKAFSSEYVKSEKNNIKQIIEAKINNKDSYAFNRCIEEMYKDMPYSLYKYGYIEDLDSIDESNLYEYYQFVIQNSKIDIFVSGDFANSNEIEKIIQENNNIQELIQRNPIIEVYNENIKEQKDELKEIQENMDISQGKLIIGIDLLENKAEDRFATTLYNTILGDSANSKLFQNVREKEHLAYTIRSIYNKTKSVLFIRAGIETSNYQKAVNIIKEQLENMKAGEFTQEDIKNAKNYIISAINSIDEEQDTEITYYFGQELSGVKYSPEEYKKKIKDITKEEIEQIAGKIRINTIFFLKNETEEGGK